MMNEENMPIYKRVGCNHYVLGECSREFGSPSGNCVGPINCIDNLIEKVHKYEQALQRIKFEVTEEMKDTDVDTNTYGCFLEIINILNKAGVH